MNKEFTRMQKLAGILTESYTAHSEGMEASNMHSDPKEAAMMEPRKGKMKKSEFKKKLKEAILAERALKEDAGDMGGDNAATMAAYADMDMTEASYEGMKRMDSLVSRNDLQAFLFSADKIMTALREDGFDDEDIINYLIELLPTPYTLSEAKKKGEEEEEDKELGDEKLIRQIANTITYFNKNIILSQG